LEKEMILKENAFYRTAGGKKVGPIVEITMEKEEYLWARWGNGRKVYEILGLPREWASNPSYKIICEWEDISLEQEAENMLELVTKLESSNAERIALRKEVMKLSKEIRDIRTHTLRQAANKVDEHYMAGDMGNPGHWILSELLYPLEKMKG
jgi:hypothetical protein